MIPFSRELAVIIASSGKQRELADGDYNVRREQCYDAARALGVRALRDVSSADLNRRTDLDSLLRQRARHIVGENERVERAIQLLAHRKAREFGELMNESHQSSQENFENSTPELDLLVELARKIPGILGARLTGGGFGGAIVALCDREKADAAARELQSAYRQQTGIQSDMFACEIGPGAS
jgi:galactokinase